MPVKVNVAETRAVLNSLRFSGPGTYFYELRIGSDDCVKVVFMRSDKLLELETPEIVRTDDIGRYTVRTDEQIQTMPVKVNRAKILFDLRWSGADFYELRIDGDGCIKVVFIRLDKRLEPENPDIVRTDDIDKYFVR